MWLWLIVSVILGATGQIFMSISMKTSGAVPKSEGLTVLFKYYLNAVMSPTMMLAVLSYGISFVLWLGVLSKKDLSLARPIVSLGYLITLFYGFMAGEHVTPARIFGTVLIIIGLFFVVQSDF